MFDVGFWEIILIGGLALVILGPERLPKVAREAGRWIGRARAMARQLRSQLEQEVSYDEYMRAESMRAKTASAPGEPEVSGPAGAQPAADARPPEENAKGDE
jgi:sec-independent protein translocase protein TatB